MPRQPLRVLISGASVAGPMVAYWLCRQGFAVTVVERMPLARVRTSGHAVDLFGPAMDVADWTGVLPAVMVALGAGAAFARPALLIAIATAIAGAAAAFYYSRAGLALTHYDARAHLVVARRILDSLMPGWQQIGAVWLPLPHVLNMLPVQIDAWYRTGASAIAISVMSMAAGAWALASLIIRRTGSVSAAIQRRNVPPQSADARRMWSSA